MTPRLICEVGRTRLRALHLEARRIGVSVPVSTRPVRAAAPSVAALHARWMGRPLAAYLSTAPRWEEPPHERPILTPPPPVVAHRPSQKAVVAPAESLVPQVEESRRLSVVAFYVGQKVDLHAIVQANFLDRRGYKISDNLLLVPLEHEAETDAIRTALVVFKHGSVVFFNVEEGEQSKYLHAVMRQCGEVVPQSHRFRETLECRLRPGQDSYHEMGQDVVNLRELSEDIIKTISDVIGHSVALNFYNQKSDKILEDFRILNNAVEASGFFREMDKKDLFKVVAQNNKILTDAMSSGLLEQTKSAWNSNRLDKLWGDLRHEFSIGDRFSKVEHKINHVHSNTKFFLEILNHQKSNKLEWIIIVLIAIEIVLTCIDLGHQFFGFEILSSAT